MIDRYLLRYFLAVVDTGTFSRAAIQCNVSQPTLSAGIAKLERLLARKLFERSSQRVHLTEAGTRLLVHARRIEGEFNQAEAVLSAVVPARTIRLGVLATVPTTRLATLVAAVGAADPPARLEIVEGTERTLLQGLQRGRIDAALSLVRDPPQRFAAAPLWSEGYALALPASHALAGRTGIAAEALLGEVMIVRAQCEALSETSRHFTERGIRPFFATKTTNDDRALALVAAGLGVTVVPRSLTREGVAQVALAGFDHQRTVGLLWREEDAAAAQALLTACRAIAW